MSALNTQKIIGVIGAGSMGAGVAQVAASAGHIVLLFDASQGAAEKGIERSAKGLDKLVQRERITTQQRDDLVARIKPVDSLDELTPAALIIEAIVEDLATKQRVFQQLENICSDDTIFATNTSSLSITAIASALKNPQRFVGMHFFNPAPIMKLVEVISGLATGQAIAETIFDTAEAWGKKAVRVKSSPGFIVNRVARPFYAEALRILQEGASNPATIDAILRDCGTFRMGAFELMDLIGHDVNYAVTKSVFDAFHGDPRFMPSLLQKELVDGGFLGIKSGHGFYNYSENSCKPQPDCCAPQPFDSPVFLTGQTAWVQAFADLIEQAGITLNRSETDDDILQTEYFTLCQSDGRMATLRAEQENMRNLILFDLAMDYAKTPRIVLAAADQTEQSAIDKAVGLLQRLGKQVTVIDDIAGLCLLRTVSMIINEAADTVNQQVCSIEAVDIALQSGVNYPLGPFAWADKIGIGKILEVLDNLQDNYGEDRYRASPLLIRHAASGKQFHD
jgi:3-hydroxybutyryl-CoA dehydrogenase